MADGLDDVDRTIIHRLVEDARGNTATAIAEDVRVSAQTVRNRITRLEDEGVIRGYHAQVDFERAEGYLTNLFMCTTATTDRERLAKQVLRVPGVVNVREIMTGRTDLRITAVGQDTDELIRIANAISDLGITIEEEDLVHREHVGSYAPFAADEGGPAITDFMRLSGDAEIAEFTLDSPAPITDTTLQEATDAGLLNDDVLIVAVERDDETVTPDGETELTVGDTVTVLARGGINERIERLFY